MNYINKTHYLPLILMFIGCSNVTFKIPQKDKQLIPYKGFETLIFKNNKAVFDTIFLQGYKEFTSPIDQWSFPLKYIEHRVLLSKRSDPNYNRRLDSLDFVSLINDGTTKIKIDLTAKHSWYVGNTYSKYEFLKLNDTTLKIENITLKDVLIVRANLAHTNRNDDISVIYWSKTLGLVMYEDFDGQIWQLVKIW